MEKIENFDDKLRRSTAIMVGPINKFIGSIVSRINRAVKKGNDEYLLPPPNFYLQLGESTSLRIVKQFGKETGPVVLDCFIMGCIFTLYASGGDVDNLIKRVNSTINKNGFMMKQQFKIFLNEELVDDK